MSTETTVRGLCLFCNWKTPWENVDKKAQKLLKTHYQAHHPREIAENRIKKWGGVRCLNCSHPIGSAENLKNHRLCANCRYDMSAWFAGMMAFASYYEGNF